MVIRMSQTKAMLDWYIATWQTMLTDYWFVFVFIIGLFIGAGLLEIYQWRKSRK